MDNLLKKYTLHDKKINYIKIIFIIIIIISIIILLMKLFKTIYCENKIYYFDNNATTFIYDQNIKDEIIHWINCGNPSNELHSEGIKARNKINQSREIIANELDVKPDDIYFTGSATEANSIVIQGIINGTLKNNKNENEKYTIITSNIEHPSVLNIFKNYELNPRLEVIIIPIRTNIEDNYYGSIDPQDLEEAIVKASNKIILISIMYANNETGAINDMKKIGEIANKYNIFLHCDVTQAIGKYIIHPEELKIQSITFSGHKFHAPKGIGCLYMKNNCKMLDSGSRKLCAQFSTNSQELHVRGGTENISYISAIALALKKVHENRNEKNKLLHQFKEYIKIQLESKGCYLINPKYNSLDNTLLIVLSGIDICNKSFAKELSDKMNICIGVSSACQTGQESHVLEAIKINKKYRDKIIRISMSDYNTFEEVKYLVKSIVQLLDNHKKIPEFNTSGELK